MGDTERKQGRPYEIKPVLPLKFEPDVRKPDPILELEDDGQVMEPIPPKAKE